MDTNSISNNAGTTIDILLVSSINSESQKNTPEHMNLPCTDKGIPAFVDLGQKSMFCQSQVCSSQVTAPSSDV